MNEKDVDLLVEKEIAKVDPWYLIDSGLLKIKTKKMQLIPFTPNTPQKQIILKIKELEEKKQPVRLKILKSRQEGVSTLTEAIIFSRESQGAYRNGYIIAHKLEGSNNLFDMTKRFQQNLPHHLKPSEKKSNKKELVFGQLDSQIIVDSAENKDPGRSHTLHDVHISEAAFFPNYSESMAALLQAVPYEPGTLVIEETTANEWGSEYFNSWEDALEGKSQWTPIFLPWNEFEEYQRSFFTESEKNMFVESLTDEEKQIKDKFKISVEQLNWRRWKIANDFNGNVDKFKKEFPLFWQEAFLKSGRNVFNTDILHDLLNYTKDPIAVGNLSENNILSNPKGYLKIWEWPEKNGQYVIGADVAEGLEKGDYSCAYVLKTNPPSPKIVAEYHGHLEPHKFGSELYKLGKYYNSAYIGVESNNHGISVIDNLVKVLHYENFYFTRIRDSLTNKITDKLGWTTNSVTKPLMMDSVAKALSEKSVYVPVIELVNEMLSFVFDERGKMGGTGKTHDDRVVAFAIGIQMLLTHPFWVETPAQYPSIKDGY